MPVLLAIRLGLAAFASAGLQPVQVKTRAAFAHILPSRLGSGSGSYLCYEVAF